MLSATATQICDDSFAVLLSAQQEIAFVGTISHINQILDRLPATSDKILLISKNLDTASILPWIRQIKSEVPGLIIFALNLERNDEFIDAGGSGYILEESSLDEALEAVEVTRRGDEDHSLDVTSMVLGRITELVKEGNLQSRIRGGILTPRETDVLQLIAIGLGNKEIAQRLNISLYTVKNHVHNILEKLRVKFRREAIRYAYENGMLKHDWPARFHNFKDDRQSAE